MTDADEQSDVDVFIERWRDSSGAERAKFQPFGMELRDLIGLPRPESPDGSDANRNPYAFKRSVDFKAPDGSITKGRIDLFVP